MAINMGTYTCFSFLQMLVHARPDPLALRPPVRRPRLLCCVCGAPITGSWRHHAGRRPGIPPPATVTIYRQRPLWYEACKHCRRGSNSLLVSSESE